MAMIGERRGRRRDGRPPPRAARPRGLRRLARRPRLADERRARTRRRLRRRGAGTSSARAGPASIIDDPDAARIDWGDERRGTGVTGGSCRRRRDPPDSGDHVSIAIGGQRDRALRRHHHRQRRRRRDAGPHPGRLGQAASCCSSGATSCPGRWTTGTPSRCSSTASTSPRTPGTTPTASRSSPRSTTTSAAPPSCTARRCTGCVRRTSASCTTSTASRRRGR